MESEKQLSPLCKLINFFPRHNNYISACCPVRLFNPKHSSCHSRPLRARPLLGRNCRWSAGRSAPPLRGIALPELPRLDSRAALTPGNEGAEFSGAALQPPGRFQQHQAFLSFHCPLAVLRFQPFCRLLLGSSTAVRAAAQSCALPLLLSERGCPPAALQAVFEAWFPSWGYTRALNADSTNSQASLLTFISEGTGFLGPGCHAMGVDVSSGEVKSHGSILHGASWAAGLGALRLGCCAGEGLHTGCSQHGPCRVLGGSVGKDACKYNSILPWVLINLIILRKWMTFVVMWLSFSYFPNALYLYLSYPSPI